METTCTVLEPRLYRLTRRADGHLEAQSFLKPEASRAIKGKAFSPGFLAAPFRGEIDPPDPDGRDV